MSRNKSSKTFSTKKSSRSSQQNNFNYQSLFLWVNFLWSLITLRMVGQRMGVQAQGLPDVLDLASLMANQGMVIEGAVVGDNVGNSVSSAGDVNGDGNMDFLIGVSQASPQNRTSAGAAYLIYGSSNLLLVLDLKNLTANQGMVIQGAVAFDYTGSSVAATDINGDGKNDILVGAWGASPQGLASAGVVYLLYGNASLPALLDLSALNATQGMVIQGIAAGDRTGWSVSSAEDVNGDGKSDILIGAPYATAQGRNQTGVAYLVCSNIFPGAPFVTTTFPTIPSATTIASEITQTMTLSQHGTTKPKAIQASTTSENSSISSDTVIGAAAGGVAGGIALTTCLGAIGFYACRKKSRATKPTNTESTKSDIALQDKANENKRQAQYQRASVAQKNYREIDATKKTEKEYENVPKLEI
jgi:hypothetical protein